MLRPPVVHLRTLFLIIRTRNKIVEYCVSLNFYLVFSLLDFGILLTSVGGAPFAGATLATRSFQQTRKYDTNGMIKLPVILITSCVLDDVEHADVRNVNLKSCASYFTCMSYIVCTASFLQFLYNTLCTIEHIYVHGTNVK